MASAKVIQMKTTRPATFNALFAQTKAALARADKSQAEYEKGKVQTQETWDKAQKSREDANVWYAKAGALLVKLKEQTPHGEWLPTLEKLGQGERRARQLMELARGDKTLTEQRESNRESMERGRRAKSATQGGGVADLADDEGEVFDPREQREQLWQNSLGNLCGDIIAAPAFWSKEMPGWEQFELPSTHRTLLAQAEAALSALIKSVAKRDRKVG